MAPLRQFLRFAKPWQRVVLGVVLAVAGWLTGIYVMAAIGIVLVILPAAALFRQWRGHAAVAPDVGEEEVAPT